MLPFELAGRVTDNIVGLVLFKGFFIILTIYEVSVKPYLKKETDNLYLSILIYSVGPYVLGILFVLFLDNSLMNL